MQCRDKLRKHIVCRLGNGKSTNVWFDNWHSLSPLSDFISYRDIYASGLSKDLKVADIVSEGKWNWPSEWKVRFPELFDQTPPVLSHDGVDKHFWRSKNGKENNFTVGNVWSDIRVVNNEVAWAKTVWFSQCIPRHSFILWLAIRCKLKTQDKIGAWNNERDLRCPFCKIQPDNHEHLFFQCDFPREIWCYFKDKIRLLYVPDDWGSIVNYMQNLPMSKSIWSILQRLVVGACVYYVWQERNLRQFQSKYRSVEDMCKVIHQVIRLKMMSLTIKDSKQVREAAEIWNLPVRKAFVGNGGK